MNNKLEEDFEEALEQVASRVGRHVLPALKALFADLPLGKEYEIDGATWFIKPFYEPRVAADHREEQGIPGDVEAGIDLVRKDGSAHIEFRIYNSGWGGAP